MPSKSKDSKKTQASKNTGTIVQIIGPVVDVEFSSGNIPDIYSALIVEYQKQNLVLEVQQHLGDNVVRAISLGPTDGIKRNTKVTNTNQPISVPVGIETLGRILNVLGDPIDNLGPVKAKKT